MTNERPSATKPSREQIRAMMEAHAAAALARPRPPVPRELTETVDLAQWLARAAAVGVPAIPAAFSEPIAVATLFRCLDQELSADETALLERVRRWLGATLRPGRDIWRWHIGAPMELKYMMGSGRPAAALAVPGNVDGPYLLIDDPRILDMLSDAGCETTRVAVRPWVSAALSAAYPVEFRVFVFPGRAGVAVSSYYPQRPLEAAWHRVAVLAGELGARFRSTVPADLPFTVDLLLREGATAETATADDLVLLEGGPGWGYGAHPCCFAPTSVAPHGVVPGAMALVPQPGAVR